jgi:hypothetical protein
LHSANHPLDARIAPGRCGNAHRDELSQRLEEKLKPFDCEPLADPQTKHRGIVVEVGEYRGRASPTRSPRTSAKCRVRPPKRGLAAILFR